MCSGASYSFSKFEVSPRIARMTNGKTPTGQRLEELEQIMERASETFAFGGSLEDAELARQRLEKRSQRMIVTDMSLDNARSVAKMTGRRIALGRQLRNVVAQGSAKQDMATVMAQTVFPDRDEAHRRASALACEGAEQLATAGHKEKAAIGFMNSGIWLFQLRNPTHGELRKANLVLEKSFGWRRKGSIDAAYHNFNLSVSRRKIIEAGLTDTTEKLFRKTLRGFDRARDLFVKHREIVPDFAVLYHQNVIETLATWMQWKIANIEQEHAKVLIREGQLAPGLEPYISALKSNPKVFGLDALPAGFPSERDILLEVLSGLPDVRSRIDTAEEALSTANDAYILDAAIYRIRSLLAPLDQIPEVSCTALRAVWELGDREKFLRMVLAALGGRAAVYDISNEYAEMLTRAFESFHSLRETWPDHRLREFLTEFSTELRFCACELARLHKWELAFNLLEDTRGLIAGGNASLLSANIEDDVSQDGYLWIHVTHSPAGTYLICNKGQDYFGVDFADLPGSLLTVLFSGFVPPGILTPSARENYRKRSVAIEFAAQRLSCIGDWVAQQETETGLLHE